MAIESDNAGIFNANTFPLYQPGHILQWASPLSTCRNGHREFKSIRNGETPFLKHDHQKNYFLSMPISIFSFSFDL